MKKISVIFLILASLAFMGCQTESGSKKDNMHFADLDGDGIKEFIELQDKSSENPESLVTVKNNNKKTGKVIDTFSVQGKIRDIEFPELNPDSQEWMAVIYDDKNNVANVAVYQLKNNRLSMIFSAASEYGIETDFDMVAKIRVGKAPNSGRSASTIPDWDTWVWTGEKFIK